MDYNQNRKYFTDVFMSNGKRKELKILSSGKVVVLLAAAVAVGRCCCRRCGCGGDGDGLYAWHTQLEAVAGCCVVEELPSPAMTIEAGDEDDPKKGRT